MTFKTKFFFSIIALLTMVCSMPAGADQTTSEKGRRNVLILNSYHKSFQWTDHQVSGASAALNDAVENLELYVEYMDTKRIYTKEYLKHLTHTYHLKYDKVRLDAIITTDDNALRFVMDHHQELFQNAPVSFCGINNYSSYSFASAKQFTGVLEVLDIKATIDLALKLHPATKQVYVVVDNTPTGVGQLRDITKAAGQYPQLKFDFIKGDEYSTAEMLEKVSQLPEDSIVLLAVWLRDKNDEYAATDEVGPLISNRSNVAVYGIIDMYLGQGIVGGKLLNSETHGRLAAEMTVEILGGETPSNIPVIVESSNPYMFDEIQLRRWDIDRADLPKGSILVNRSFSLYETYRFEIWCIVGVFVVLLVVITLMVANITERKRAEEKLYQFQKAVNSSSDAIGMSTPEGKHYYQNKAFTELFGLSVEETNSISGPPATVFVDEKVGREVFETIMKGDSWADEVEMVGKGNRRLSVLLRAYSINDKGGNVIGLVGVHTDITGRKQAAEALCESEKKYRTLFEQSADATLIIEGDKFIDCNQATVEMLGYSSKKELLDTHPSQLSPEFQSDGRRSFEKANEIMAIAYEQGSHRFEWDHKRRNGEVFPVEVLLTDIAMEDRDFLHVVWRDITDRKQAENKLKDSERRNRAWLEHSPVCTKIVDLDFNLQFMSRAGVVGLNIVDITEYYGKPYPFAFYPESFNNLMTGNLEKVRETGEIIEQEGSVVDIDGNELWFHSTLVPVNDDKGQLDYIMVVSMDTTARKKAELEVLSSEQQLKASNQQLMASERQLKATNQQLAANEQQLRASNLQLRVNENEREKLVKTLEYKNKELRDIVYTTSHDLRSPLVNIEGFSGELHTDCDRLLDMLAKVDIGEDERQEIEVLLKENIPESLAFIAGSAKKMSSLLNGLLQISRVGSVEIKNESIDMNKTISEVLASMEYQLKENNIDVSVDNLSDCVGDLDMLNKVFSNLVENAIKYRDEAKESEISISCQAKDGMSIYCVADNGVGIESSYRKKIFEIFHRLNPEDDIEGEGLGLTIVTRVLDRLGGTIRVESEPGKGSKFFVALPAGSN